MKNILQLILFFTLVLTFSTVALQGRMGAGSTSTPSLFTVDQVDGSRTPQESSVTITQSVEEWNLVDDTGVISSTQKVFDIELPDVGASTYSSYTVVRDRYRQYSLQQEQFVGLIYPFGATDSPPVGRIIVNKINSNLYGSVTMQDATYELYTDPVLGARLARVVPQFSNFHIDYDYSQQVVTETPTEGIQTITPPDVSIIDVLILIDSNADNQFVRERILSKKLDADAILALSGSDTAPRGVPFELNVVGIDTVEVPPGFDSLDRLGNSISHMTCFNFPETPAPSCPNTLNSDLIAKRDAIGADVVVLYTDPVIPPFDPDKPLDNPACGLITRVDTDGLFTLSNDRFDTRFSLHDVKCTNAQFVFLHEILHNFGMGHDINDLPVQNVTDLFEPYALGISSQGVPIASVMGCSNVDENGSELPPTPSAEVTCNRVMRISDPDEIVNEPSVKGFQLGVDGQSDGFRYLTECTIFDSPSIELRYRRCPRERMAVSKMNLSSNAAPQVSIFAPIDGQTFLVNDIITFDASVKDDDIINLNSVTWSAIKIGSNNQPRILQTLTAPHPVTGWGISASFKGKNQGTGQYIVSATAVDSGGQITTDSIMISVLPEEVADIAVELKEFGSYGVMTTITNLGPSTGNNITVEINYDFSNGISSQPHTNQVIQLPNICTLGPFSPWVENCLDGVCNSSVTCNINALNPGDEIKVIQRVCIVTDQPTSFEVNAVVAENFGPADLVLSNNSARLSFDVCDYNNLRK